MKGLIWMIVVAIVAFFAALFGPAAFGGEAASATKGATSGAAPARTALVGVTFVELRERARPPRMR